MDVRRFSRRMLLIGAVALPTLLRHDAGAQAATPRNPATIPSVDTVQVGPISAGAGFSLYLTTQDCGSSHPSLQVTYLEGTSAVTLGHTYSGASATCSIRRAPAAAQLRVNLPGVIDVGVQIGEIQPALAHPGLPVGCGAPYGPELPATATGHIDVAIHPSVLGRIAAQTANAQIFSGAPQRCPARQSTDGRQLTADVGRYILNADQPTHGPAQLQILDPIGDSPSPGLQGTLELQMAGPSALGVNGANGSLRIGAQTSLTAGSLSFTVLAVCPGYVAQNGGLRGILTIEDPLLGDLRVIGTEANLAFSGPGAAQSGSCDGPGSQPVFPELITSCDQVESGCSVSEDSSVATFFDESSPGTQTITSETVDFGDGSPPAAITNYGSVQHAYAGAGTYTATLTVTDASGTLLTVSTPVVIDP